MINKVILKKLAVSFLLPIGMALIYVSAKSPAIVERLYSEGMYPTIGRTLSKATGIFPFSLAELIFILAPTALIAYTAVILTRMFSDRRGRSRRLLGYIANVTVIFSAAFFTFVFIWGLNYYRMPFASIAGLEVKPASVKELEGLCQDLILRANELRTSVSTASDGSVDIPGSKRDILNNCYKGYEALSSSYPSLSGSYGNPKPILLSELMNYTGICGIYFPYTGEANVNIRIPEATLPSTAAHEMAHQRGFSREDEANYISYLACSAHPDVNYKYSGVLLALINSMNALHNADPDSYSKLSGNYSTAVRNDLVGLNAFWKKYEGPVERTSDRINNTYLKANNQKDGVKSYGRMVDLLIAEHRKSAKKSPQP